MHAHVHAHERMISFVIFEMLSFIVLPFSCVVVVVVDSAAHTARVSTACFRARQTIFSRNAIHPVLKYICMYAFMRPDPVLSTGPVEAHSKSDPVPAHAPPRTQTFSLARPFRSPRRVRSVRSCSASALLRAPARCCAPIARLTAKARRSSHRRRRRRRTRRSP